MIEEKYTEAQRLGGQYQVYQFTYNESSRKRRERKGQKFFWRNNGQKLHKFDEKY